MLEGIEACTLQEVLLIVVIAGRPMTAGVGLRGRTRVVDTGDGDVWIVRWAQVMSNRIYCVLDAILVDVGEFNVSSNQSFDNFSESCSTSSHPQIFKVHGV
jgi:nitrous oxidase accessory protein NosD